MLDRRQYEVTLNSGIKVHGVRTGNPNGYHCIILGPGSVYLECIPEKLKEKVEFITADMYWNIDTNVKPHAINKLTVLDMLRDVHEVQKKLKIERILILGPSVLGLLAMEYARLYAKDTLGAVGLGTPMAINDFYKHPKDGCNFFKRNCRPSNETFRTYPNVKDPDKVRALKTWNLFEQSEKEYIKYQQNSTTQLGGTEEKHDIQKKGMRDYQAELSWLSPRIYWHPDRDSDCLAELWGCFNICTRQRLFEILPSYDFSKIKDSPTPSLNLIGLGDGLAPFYFTTNYVEKAEPKNFDYHILEESRHNPFVDQPLETANVMMNWIDEHLMVSKNIYRQSKL
jgi:pimeloyl-ACP methyl ester carboxylesterase